MENYKKGKNVEEPLERDKIPIPNLPENFLWMHVRGGSKIRNLLTHALNEFPETKSVVWTGFGPSIGKAVTCAEIMKREHNNKLFQITKLCNRIIDEYWDPVIPELDQIVVKRRLPMIHIYLSLDAILNKDELGYQEPGVIYRYNPPNSSSNNSKNSNNNSSNNYNNRRQNKKEHQQQNKKFRQAPTKEFAAMNVKNQNKLINTKNNTPSSSSNNSQLPESSNR